VGMELFKSVSCGYVLAGSADSDVSYYVIASQEEMADAI
jgi:hypothetical protein